MTDKTMSDDERLATELRAVYVAGLVGNDPWPKVAAKARELLTPSQAPKPDAATVEKLTRRLDEMREQFPFSVMSSAEIAENVLELVGAEVARLQGELAKERERKAPAPGEVTTEEFDKLARAWGWDRVRASGSSMAELLKDAEVTDIRANVSRAVETKDRRIAGLEGELDHWRKEFARVSRDLEAARREAAQARAQVFGEVEAHGRAMQNWGLVAWARLRSGVDQLAKWAEEIRSGL